MAIPTSYPLPASPLASYFSVPTPDQQANNPDYWNAYAAEQAHVTTDCPSATNIMDWATYHATVIVSLPPRAPWDSAATGRAQCVFDAADWEWDWNPLSGHNKVF